MQITANSTEIFYQRHLGGDPVILLHGWGGSHISMQGLYDYLSKLGLDVISPDLPGFGQSPVPDESFGIKHYADCVKEIIEKLNLTDVTLVGHSFGGRICILLAADPACSARIKRIMLVDSAGLKPRFSLKKAIKIRRYKRAVKKGRDVSAYGSADYKALSGPLRTIFIKIVNTHLDAEVTKITVPTLLVWGRHDTETPLYMALKLKRNIPDCGLVLLEGGHYAYAEQHRQFCAVAKSFILG